MDADPVWPVVVLAAICLADAVMCVRPMSFIAQCLDDVGLPRRLWPLLAPLKAAAGAGLLIGLWWGPLGVVTGVALIAYFAVAITMHVRARDLGRNAFNATALLVVSAAVTWFCFVT